LTLIFIFVAAIFDKMWTKDIFGVDMLTVVTRSS